MRYSKHVSILFFSLWAFVFVAAGQTNEQKLFFRDTIPAPVGYVNDYDTVYTASQRDALEQLIQHFEVRTTMQIVIITCSPAMLGKDSLDGMTMKVANIWGVGQKDKNNGIAIGICRGCRQMTIQTGLGIQSMLTNDDLKQIISTDFTPDFKNGDFYSGTLNGVRSLMQRLYERAGIKPD